MSVPTLFSQPLHIKAQQLKNIQTSDDEQSVVIGRPFYEQLSRKCSIKMVKKIKKDVNQGQHKRLRTKQLAKMRSESEYDIYKLTEKDKV